MAHNEAFENALNTTIALAFRAGYHETAAEMRIPSYTRVILRRRSAALCAVESFGGWDVTVDGIAIPLSANRSSRVAEVLAPVSAATAVMRGMKRVSS